MIFSQYSAFFKVDFAKVTSISITKIDLTQK